MKSQTNRFLLVFLLVFLSSGTAFGEGAYLARIEVTSLMDSTNAPPDVSVFRASGNEDFLYIKLEDDLYCYGPMSGKPRMKHALRCGPFVSVSPNDFYAVCANGVYYFPSKAWGEKPKKLFDLKNTPSLVGWNSGDKFSVKEIAYCDKTGIIRLIDLVSRQESKIGSVPKTPISMALVPQGLYVLDSAKTCSFFGRNGDLKPCTNGEQMFRETVFLKAWILGEEYKDKGTNWGEISKTQTRLFMYIDGK